MAKLVVILLLLAIVASLFTSMFFLVKDGSERTRTLTGLKVRIILSIVLVAFVLLSFFMGWLQPHSALPPEAPRTTSP